MTCQWGSGQTARGGVAQTARGGAHAAAKRAVHSGHLSVHFVPRRAATLPEVFSFGQKYVSVATERLEKKS